MKALLYYLVQVFISSGILYAYYHFALRNKKFHHYNRFYLLAATVISITIPFLNIPVYFAQTETDSSFVLQTLTVFSSSGTDAPVIIAAGKQEHINWFTWQNLSYAFYILIASIVLLRIIISLIKIRRIAKNNPIEQIDNIRFVNTNEPGTPFSFFRWLFWNRKIELRSEKGEQIFRHELFHIEQKHSWDIMYMELLTVIFWINPFFHLIKKEVKAIHEFLADQFAITENTKWQYAELLLMQALNTNQQLVNPFFHNQIKRRVAMITTSKKPRYQYLRKLMVLPLVSISVILFAFNYKTRLGNQSRAVSPNHSLKSEFQTTNDTLPEKIQKKSFFYSKTDNLILEADTLLFLPEASKIKPDLKKSLIIINGETRKNDILRIKTIIADEITFYSAGNDKAIRKYGKEAEHGVVIFKNAKIINIPPTEYYKEELNPGRKIQPSTDNIIFDKVETPPSFPGGEAKWRHYLERTLDASVPVKKKAPEGSYTVYVLFVVDINGNISDIKPLTNHGFGMEEEAMKVIRLGPRWIPAIQNGRQVNAYKKQPITFVIGDGEKNYPSAVKPNGNELSEVVVTTLSPQKTDNKVFDKVETPPTFPGGDTAWRKYLEKTLNASVPVDSGAKEGTYKIIVQFIVHEDGFISDIKPLTNFGYGMENEVMRVIKAGPKWMPARQNGHVVKSYKQQPVTFVVTDDGEDIVNAYLVTADEGNQISIADLKKTTKLKIFSTNNINYEIVSFRITIDHFEGTLYEVVNMGATFNESLRKLLSNCNSKTFITIEDIVTKIGGATKKLTPKIYTAN